MTEIRFPWSVPAALPAKAAPFERGPPRARGRRPASPLAPATAWRHGQLLVQGPAAALDAFTAAARGSGITPWTSDAARLEEDVFHAALRVPAESRGLSVEGCHRLARRYREAVVAHQARAAAQARMQPAARDACPFDLHRLIPVPEAILALGLAHEAAEAWCLAHWGVLELRRVTWIAAPRGPRLPAGTARAGYDFWARGGEGLALDPLRRLWPALLFHLQA